MNLFADRNPDTSSSQSNPKNLNGSRRSGLLTMSQRDEIFLGRMISFVHCEQKGVRLQISRQVVEIKNMDIA